LKVSPPSNVELFDRSKVPTTAQNDDDEHDTSWSSVPNGNACLDQLPAACAADGATTEAEIKAARSPIRNLGASETIAREA
jgi:hypothetical protein